MNSQPTFYKESGNFQASNLLLALLGLFTVSLVLGYLYSALTTFIPFIYLNAVILIGLGFVIGYATLIVCKLSGIRNSLIRISLALAMGLIIWYFQWTVYLLYIGYETMPSLTEYVSNLGWIFYDSELWQIFLFYNENGYYEMSSLEISGGMLAVIWIIEFAVIIGAPLLAVANYNPLPYSDTYNKWYDKYTLKRQFRKMANSNATQELLNSDACAALREMEPGRANSHSIVNLFYLPRENKQYLQIENAKLQKREKESKLEKIIIVNNIEISTRDAKAILDEFDHDKQGFQLM